MMKKIFSLFIAVVCVFACGICMSGCFKNRGTSPTHRITLNLPNQVHVEYGAYSNIIFVKDGNEYYLRASNTHGSHRNEIYMKRELSNPVFVLENYGGWNFITALYNSYSNSWQVAEQEDTNASWIENDKNQNTYTNAESALRTGYTDINIPYNNPSVTLTQKENETLVIGGENVECIVWDYVYENEDVYSKSRYWFEKNTHICIKFNEVFDKEENVNDDANIEFLATYFKVGESMETALEVVSSHIGQTRTKCIFDEKYQ